MTFQIALRTVLLFILQLALRAAVSSIQRIEGIFARIAQGAHPSV